ncbi:hypothetical protein M441DRAFT_32383 [Trichoderma asperellum CBS 433.97]|uniref:Ubiquitin-like protease family profile domain-containing protein n=1 Tax=Trichoderma asperellum (strain ATCC 204424 / CBS 433.97 / NBRC 101777) TaxID=1042311 RepID=A0A2T3YQY0_TRIA4|nr:hypothetical protein M441DRAFT_32383 [Trichoderma asperellum CBS 433.97]PTB34926.1 hypothetical protein M441DRAFT_32383 [Trichoderma asperellum CBS 433.97]
MSSSVSINDVQSPRQRMISKLTGIMDNILELYTDTSDDIDNLNRIDIGNEVELCAMFKNIIRKRTDNEQSLIASFAISLDSSFKGSDELPTGHEGLPGIVDDVSGDSSEESEYSSSDEASDIESEPAAEGDTMEYDSEFRDIRRWALSRQLLVKSTGHKFSVDALETLAPNECLSIDIVIACLHLCTKLPGVRAGSLIALYHKGSNSLRSHRPLEKAAKQIAAWDEAEKCPRKVYFFPLLHYNNSFSLLEVDIKERYIHHYDPIWTARSRMDDACMEQFPTFKYAVKYGIMQPDSQSCGLAIIGYACIRMLGYPTTPADFDVIAFRLQAVFILNSAWKRGELLDASMPLPKRQGLSQPAKVRDNKRQKH